MSDEIAKEIINERATQLEGIGFVFKNDANNCWYEKNGVKMIPTLMMCAPFKDWNDFIEKHKDPTPEGVTAEAVLESVYKKIVSSYPEKEFYEWGDKELMRGFEVIIYPAMHEYASLVSASKDEEIARLKEDVKELVDGLEKMGFYFDKFMPKEVDTESEKQMAMYGAYHTRKQLIQKHKL